MRLGKWETTKDGLVRQWVEEPDAASAFFVNVTENAAGFVRALHAAHERGEVAILSDVDRARLRQGRERAQTRAYRGEREPLTAREMTEAVRHALPADWGEIADAIGAAVAKAMRAPFESVSTEELAALRDVAESAQAAQSARDSGLAFALPSHHLRDSLSRLDVVRSKKP